MARGGQVRFYPLQKEGVTENVLAVLKGGGGTKGFEVVLISELELLAIVMGGGERKKFPPLIKRRGGGQKFYPVLMGGAKSSGPAIFSFCSPPSL